MLFGASLGNRPSGTTIVVSAVTDNKGNSYLLDKLLTTRFPAFLVLMEVAEQLEEMDISLSLEWKPREQNQEADALTNSDFSLFDPSLRVEVDLQALPLR
eukprot:978592-Amphidinium_carterae.1